MSKLYLILYQKAELYAVLEKTSICSIMFRACPPKHFGVGGLCNLSFGYDIKIEGLVDLLFFERVVALAYLALHFLLKCNGTLFSRNDHRSEVECV
jgi:hypothetical protein